MAVSSESHHSRVVLIPANTQVILLKGDIERDRFVTIRYAGNMLLMLSEDLRRGIGVVSEAEFGHDARLAAVRVTDVTMLTREYVACLKERRRLRIVSAFLDQAYGRLKRVTPTASRS